MAEPKTCRTCIYSHWDGGLWLRTLWSGFPARPTCANQPDAPGQIRECPAAVCRNYRPRPPVPTGETVKKIPLTNGFYAYVDAADYEWLNQWRWRVYNGYAGRYEKRKRIYMHRQIMQPPPGLIVDHINGNGFDNTRGNMRNVTRRENTYNMCKRVGTTSMYKGVSYSKERRTWHGHIRCGSKRLYLGHFDTEIEAARAYDRKAVELFGEHARPNLPEEWPPERRAEVHRLCPPAHGEREEGKRRTKGKKTRTEYRGQRTADKKARSKDGGQKADRRPRTEDRGRKTTGKKGRTEDGRRRTAQVKKVKRSEGKKAKVKSKCRG